ncbi:MAG: hypothetical protein WKF87_06890 [Chryseolinea sp.]
MKKVSPDIFFHQLTVPQLMQTINKMNREMRSTVKECFIEGVLKQDWVHYMQVSDERLPTIFTSFEVTYFEYGGPELSRHVRDVRVYVSEFESDFYRALDEYETPYITDENKILFN